MAGRFPPVSIKGTGAAESGARRSLTLDTAHGPATIVMYDGGFYLTTAAGGTRQVAAVTANVARSLTELGTPDVYLSGLTGATDLGLTTIGGQQVRHLRGGLNPQAIPGIAPPGGASPYSVRASQMDLYISPAGELVRLTTHLEMVIDLTRLAGPRSPISGTLAEISDAAWNFHDDGRQIKVPEPAARGTATEAEVAAVLTGTA